MEILDCLGGGLGVQSLGSDQLPKGSDQFSFLGADGDESLRQSCANVDSTTPL